MKLEDEIKQERFKSEEQKLIINLIYTNYWLVEKFKQHLKPHDISMQQYNILRILRGQGDKPSTVNLLKDRMLDKSSDASRLVERLRLKGLVERVICPSDRRSVEVRITQKGLDLLENVDADEDQFAINFQRISKEEVASLNKLLDNLRS